MTKRSFRSADGLSRRAFLRAAAVAGGSTVASAALGEDAALLALIEQDLCGDFGLDFDSAARTFLMPKASLPTLSPATVQYTDEAIRRYEGIVARGGWPEVAKAERLRLGSR